MSPVSRFLPDSSAATWAGRLFSPANTLLARLEQRLSKFPMRWRRCSFVAFDFRNRTGAFTRRAFCFLPVTHDRWTSVSQLSMGRSLARDRLFVDLFCAVAAMATGPDMVARVSTPGYGCSVSRGALFLLKLLLFKLMLMSGVVKLTSGDDSWGWLNQSFQWSALTALDYHYWSQPLPTVFAWWADQSPEWFKHFSVAFCLAVEIIVPFFIWAPRRPRLMAAGLMIFLQIIIALTGNYCFFNLLTIALCLLLIDDAAIGTSRRDIPAPINGPPNASPARTGRALPMQLCSYAALAVIVVTLPINTWLIFSAFKPQSRPPGWLAKFYEQLEAFRIVTATDFSA